jgi:hypothetical protein
MVNRERQSRRQIAEQRVDFIELHHEHRNNVSDYSLIDMMKTATTDHPVCRKTTNSDKTP